MDGGLISTIDLTTKFDLAIKFVDALVIKNKPYNLNSFSLLRCVGFVLFNANHCRILWEGGVKILRVFEFQIVILHS
jgi:hypothetical protein